MLAGDFGRRHLEEHHVVRGLQDVGVGEVHFELAVAVLVIDLIDVDADGPHARTHFIEHRARPRKTLVVVTRLIERIRIVERSEAPVGLALEQHEFGLDARIHRQTLRLEACQLILERHARAIGIGFATDVTVARDACKARHPRQCAECLRIADAHVVGTVRPHAEAPERESGESRAFVEHHAVVLDRHRLGLRSPVDVHELREHVSDVVIGKPFLSLLRCHSRFSSLAIPINSCCRSTRPRSRSVSTRNSGRSLDRTKSCKTRTRRHVAV